MTLDEIKEKRFQFLYKLYKLTDDGDVSVIVNIKEVSQALNFDGKLSSKIANYLKDEYLLEFKAFGGDIAITHQGVLEIEKAKSNPDKPTEYFLPFNLISIGQMINSQIQQASPKAVQQATINENKLEELKDIIKSLKESVDKLGFMPQQIFDLQAEIKTIEAQISSSQPKSSIIYMCIRSIKSILEGTLGSIIAANLLNRINNFVGG